MKLPLLVIGLLFVNMQSYGMDIAERKARDLVAIAKRNEFKAHSLGTASSPLNEDRQLARAALFFLASKSPKNDQDEKKLNASNERRVRIANPATTQIDDV